MHRLDNDASCRLQARWQRAKPIRVHSDAKFGYDEENQRTIVDAQCACEQVQINKWYEGLNPVYTLFPGLLDQQIDPVVG